MVLERPTRPSRTNTQKRCPFHYKALESKSRKSRDTWSKGQIWPWSTEWSRAKANRVLPRECTGHSIHSSNNTREDSTHEHHQMVNTEIIFIIFFAAKVGEALYSQQTLGDSIKIFTGHIMKAMVKCEGWILLHKVRKNQSENRNILWIKT